MESSSSQRRFSFARQDSSYVWQDRDIRFDSPRHVMELRGGESVLGQLKNVEDTKGNNGERGTLLITNMRVMWQSQRMRRTNLSIGLDCIISTAVRQATSRLKGNTKALYVLCRYSGSRFEFIFTNLMKDSPRLFAAVDAVVKAYEQTRAYRDLTLRTNLLKDGELILLKGEQIINKVHGVWNLSNDQGTLGTFIITNVRTVWFSNISNNFNASVPYLQIKSVRLRLSKFGKVVVMEIHKRSGGQILGFRLDPQERLQEVQQELESVWMSFTTAPIFGIDSLIPESSEPHVPAVEDDVTIVDTPEQRPDALSAYFAEGGKMGDRDPVYTDELGLAVEGLRDDMTLDKLWSII